MRRLPRAGFWQKRVMPMFGYFPWECPLCRKLIYLKKRGKRVRRSSEWVGQVMVDGRNSATFRPHENGDGHAKPE